VNLPLHERMTRWSSLFYEDLDSLFAPDLVESLPTIDRLEYLDGEREQMHALSTSARCSM
jgi:hypothetical protein